MEQVIREAALSVVQFSIVLDFSMRLGLLRFFSTSVIQSLKFRSATACFLSDIRYSFCLESYQFLFTNEANWQ